MVMKKNTILYILLAFLIIANGFFLVNYLGRSRKPDGQKGPGDFIVKELNFDASQMERFHLLNEEPKKGADNKWVAFCILKAQEVF